MPSDEPLDSVNPGEAMNGGGGRRSGPGAPTRSRSARRLPDRWGHDLPGASRVRIELERRRERGPTLRVPGIQSIRRVACRLSELLAPLPLTAYDVGDGSRAWEGQCRSDDARAAPPPSRP